MRPCDWEIIGTPVMQCQLWSELVGIGQNWLALLVGVGRHWSDLVDVRIRQGWAVLVRIGWQWSELAIVGWC